MGKEVEALTVLIAARTAEFDKLMNSAERRIDKVERRMRGSTALVERDAQRMAQRVSKSFDDVGKSMSLSGVVIGGIGLAALTKEAISYSDAFAKVRNQLAAAGIENGKLGDTQDRVRKIADDTRSSYEATGDLYAKLTRASVTLGKSQDDVARATEVVNKAFKAGGALTSEATNGIIQLSQALGSGTLQGDELRSIRENAPLLAKAIAEAFGTTVAGLKDLGAAGALTSGKVFDAILKGGAEIDKQYAATVSTVADAFTRINTALTDYVGKNENAQGATRALINGLNYLADNFDETADVALKFAGVIAAALVGRAIGGMIASLGLGIVELGKFARALTALRAAGGLASLTGAFGGLGAALGPIGALLGVAAAAGLYFYSESQKAADSAQRAADAINAIGVNATSSADQVRKLVEEMAKLSGAKLQADIQDTSELISQQASLLRAGGKALPGQGGVGRGKVVPASGAALEYNRATDKFLKDNDVAAYKRTLDDLAKRYPKQARAMAEAEKAADLYSAAINRREAQDKAAAQQAQQALAPGVPKPRTLDDNTNSGLSDLAGAAAASAVAGRALSDSGKSDHERAVDNQTDDLVKAFTATGQKITDAIREALRRQAEAIVSAGENKKAADAKFGSSSNGQAFSLITDKEGYSSTPYEDYTVRNGKRVSSGLAIGYGFHAVNGRTVQAGDRITRDEADAELKRRIAQYEAQISEAIGPETFDKLSSEQKAALDSIVHNYGSLPTNIANALKTGTTDDVAKAIRARADDNGGINRERRNKEADMFAGGATYQEKKRDDAADFDKNSARDSKRKVEDLDAETDAIKRKGDAIAQGAIEQNYFDAQAERSKYIQEELRKLQDDEIEASPERVAKINEHADAVVAAAKRKFDAEKSYQDLKRQSEGLRDAEDFFAEGATSAFTDVITGAKSAKDAVRDLVKSLAEAAIQALLLGKGPLAGIFGTGEGGGIFGALFKGLGGVSIGAGRASGGRVSRGQVYPVGENGREFFAPGENGRIIPEGAMTQPAMVKASTPRSTVSPTLRMSIDLRGANGDETIRRISDQAARAAAQQAYTMAVATSDQRLPRNQNRLDLHGHV